MSSTWFLNPISSFSVDHLGHADMININSCFAPLLLQWYLAQIVE